MGNACAEGICRICHQFVKLVWGAVSDFKVPKSWVISEMKDRYASLSMNDVPLRKYGSFCVKFQEARAHFTSMFNHIWGMHK